MRSGDYQVVYANPLLLASTERKSGPNGRARVDTASSSLDCRRDRQGNAGNPRHQNLGLDAFMRTRRFGMGRHE